MTYQYKPDKFKEFCSKDKIDIQINKWLEDNPTFVVGDIKYTVTLGDDGCLWTSVLIKYYERDV